MIRSEFSLKMCIPLDSTESLWEWHIPSDRLWLSRGARTMLGLRDQTERSMAEFLDHIPTDCLPMLHTMREGVLSGATGSLLESSYPFDQLIIREYLIVLERDEQNRAVRVLGGYTGSVSHTSYLPSVASDPASASRGGTGFWQCSLQTRRLQLDGRSAELLGRVGCSSHMSIKEWTERLHPEEGDCKTRYELIFSEPAMGDTIEDVLRVRMDNGEYARLMVRGAILERDAQGRAVSLAGTLQTAEARMAGDMPGGHDNGRLLFAINAAGDGVWDWDAQTDSVYFSPRYLAMVGYTAEEFPGDLDAWAQKVHPDDYYKIIPPQRKIVESPLYGDTFECTYRLKRADGTWAWILGRGYVTHRNVNGRATRLVGLHTDITATQGEREQLEDLVKNDALTGLRSRAFCDLELERIESVKLRPVSVISADINGLKLINDYLGHAEGDKLLCRAAMMLRHSLRATDCVARMGGDEFVILLPGCTEMKAGKLLDQLSLHITEENKNSGEIPVFLSFGLACANSPDVSLARVLVEADRRMMCNKVELRPSSQHQIKEWIENTARVCVSLEDERYQG